MVKRFVLHIGANKTGTSSIQQMLVENRGALNQAGWEYPDYHLQHMAHHPLAYSISGHPQNSLPPGWRDTFKALTADPQRRFVFSSELFFRTTDPAKVVPFFPPDETVVVLYLREHLAYMMSWYAQAIQERNLTASFADYIRLFPTPFTRFLETWENAYGTENVVVRIFDRAQLIGQDSRRDFLHFLEGVGDAEVQFSARESNLSISGNLLFFKKMLNHYITYEEATAFPITDEVGAFAGVQPSFQGKFHVPPADVATVKQVFARDTDLLAKRGIVFAPVPAQVEGHRCPDFQTLRSDFKTIKRIAIETKKNFLTYTDRWQDWHGI